MSTPNTAAGPEGRGSRTRGKVLPVMGALSLVAGAQVATQLFAYTFSFNASLGGNFHNVYAPWSIGVWASKWYGQYPDQVMQAAGAGVAVGAVGLIGVAIAKALAHHSARPSEHLHGSARFAEKKDLQSAGLLPRERTWADRILGKQPIYQDSVYVGAWRDTKGTLHYLRHSGPEHILAFAPTRAGKGVCLVVPTLLSWKSSCIVSDVKGELYAITAGWRKTHAKNRVVRFEPASMEGGARWNPLDEIRTGTDYEVGDAQNVSMLLVDPDGKGLSSHWDKTAQALLTGMVLHAIYKGRNEGKRATLALVDHMLADPNRDIAELWVEMVTYGHQDGITNPIVAAAARDMMDRPDDELGSVLSTAKSHLALYRDPVVAHNTSASDFSVRDLKHHDDPVTVYIVTQPADKDRLRPLTRLLWTMVVRVLVDKMEFERVPTKVSSWRRLLVRFGLADERLEVRGKMVGKHRLLLMFDEFASQGKLLILQESLAYMAGYDIKAYLICQDTVQLSSREMGYGPDQSITSNCHIQVAFSPNRLETARYLSDQTGTTTVIKEAITTSGRRASAVLSQVSRTYQETQRPLMTPDEILRMPGPVKDGNRMVKGGRMLLYVANQPMVYGEQAPFFLDDVFQARAAVVPPAQTDRLRVPVSVEVAEEAISV